mmetsp:Transcript_16699/g.51911  ORF Transcript_16699/g.51911 Transcript_16699/m.51911 type:complete len:221 (-) Transcript_16699:907-1569(-)
MIRSFCRPHTKSSPWCMKPRSPVRRYVRPDASSPAITPPKVSALNCASAALSARPSPVQYPSATDGDDTQISPTGAACSDARDTPTPVDGGYRLTARSGSTILITMSEPAGGAPQPTATVVFAPPDAAAGTARRSRSSAPRSTARSCLPPVHTKTVCSARPYVGTMASRRRPYGPKARTNALIAAGSIGSAPLIACRRLCSLSAGRAFGSSAFHLRAASA